MESHCFPEGLRILVVDHDPQGLDSLHKMLIKCKYKATLCNSAQEALHLLGTREDEFDIVLGDVDLPDMDGFEFLQQVVHKTDIPVIMMSDDGEASKVMKGVQHGACHCLLKPIRLKEIRNIWQHVFRKRMHEQDNVVGNKRKHADNNTVDVGVGVGVGVDADAVVEPEPDPHPDPTPLNKKPRVVWTPELHLKFVNAVHCIGGLEKVGPKKILDLMGEPWLTRDNVASHLQKYRISVSRQKKENELKASYNGMNLPDSHQNIVMNHNNNNNNQNDTSICAMPNDTGFYVMPMVADQRGCTMPMVSDQRWEYIDQPMVADQLMEYIDQRMEYIDQPMVAGERMKYSTQAMEYSDEPMVADQGMKYSDQPMEYNDQVLEATYNWSTDTASMEATDNNLCSNSLSISYAVGTDHAKAYQKQKITMHCLW